MSIVCFLSHYTRVSYCTAPIISIPTTRVTLRTSRERMNLICLWGGAVAYSAAVAQRHIVYMLSVVACNVTLIVRVLIMGAGQ